MLGEEIKKGKRRKIDEQINRHSEEREREILNLKQKLQEYEDLKRKNEETIKLQAQIHQDRIEKLQKKDAEELEKKSNMFDTVIRNLQQNVTDQNKQIY